MKIKQCFFFSLLLISTLSCSGGVVGNGDMSSTSGEGPATDALVQLIDFEMFRNLLVEGMELPTSGESISFLDSRSVLFGGPNEFGRRSNLATATRRKATFELADMACRESLEQNSDVLFPEGADVSELYFRLRGQRPTEGDQELIDNINSLSFSSLMERRHAQCVACLVSVKTHLK